MCKQCGPNFLEFESNRPGSEEDLPFTADEFINACRLARDGPFEDHNNDWTRLVRMYNRMITLRIDVVQYCEDVFPEELIGSPLWVQFLAADHAHMSRPSLPFGLPFSVEEFLTICREVTELHKAKYYGSVEIHKGSRKLFLMMVYDLGHHRVDLREFLADHVPANMEKDRTLYFLLAAAQGQHTQDYVVNFTRFGVSLLAPNGVAADGRLAGALTHFQAAVLVQTLPETVQIPQDHVETITKPHGRCTGVGTAADAKFVLSPCCNTPFGMCCLMTILTRDGPVCPLCLQDLVQMRRNQLREQ